MATKKPFSPAEKAFTEAVRNKLADLWDETESKLPAGLDLDTAELVIVHETLNFAAHVANGLMSVESFIEAAESLFDTAESALKKQPGTALQ